MLELREIFDPRGPWAKARRPEVHKWAVHNGVNLDPAMPKDLMVRQLKKLGIGPPTTSFLTSDGPKVQPEKETIEVDATDALEAQWNAERAKPKDLTFNEMRAAIKAKGIKLDRRWRYGDVKVLWQKHCSTP